MKAIVKIIMVAAMMFMFNIAANAQIFINGVEVFTKLTKEEVISKFGEPTKCEVYDSEDNGVDIWYYYDEDILIFNDNYLIDFTICSNKFVVRVGNLNHDIKVGDAFTVLQSLEPEYIDNFGKNWYEVYECDESVSFNIENGLIKYIIFSASY